MKRLLWLLFLPPIIVPELPLVVNSTDSVPVGLYRTMTADGPYAVIALDPKTIQAARLAGMDLDDRPILKPVYWATQQDPILFSENGFTIHGRLLQNTAPKSLSRVGKPLCHYAFGRYENGLWAISDYNPKSFDSRYFGPIRRAQIQHYARPFLVAK